MSDPNQDSSQDNPGYFLSLGAGPFQLPLLEAAHRLGLRTIAVDRNMQAPGMQQADLQIQSDITSSDFIIRSIQENLHNGRLKGVATRSFGAASISVAQIAAHFGLLHNPVDHLRRIYHKRSYKSFLKERGIPVPQAFNIENIEDRESLAAHPPPILVRPSSGHAKLGLQLLEDPAAINSFINNHDSKQDLLIEEIIPGHEYTVMGLVENGRYATILITDKETSAEAPLFAEFQHTYPAQITSDIVDQISITMQRIVEASQIRQGPVVAEFIQPADRSRFKHKLYLVECAPETGGEYLADQLLPRIYPAADYFADLVRLACGYTINLQDYRPESIKIALRFFLQRDGVLNDFDLAQKYQQHNAIFFFRQLKSKGETTSTLRGNLDRLAVFGFSQARHESQPEQINGFGDSFQQTINHIVKSAEIHYD